MAVEFVGVGVEDAVELEDGDRVLELEAAGKDGEPLVEVGRGVLGRGGEVADAALACDLLGERVDPEQRVALVRAMVIAVACTFDQVMSETRPTCSRTVIASSTSSSTPIMSARTVSFCARRTSSTFSSIVAR